MRGSWPIEFPSIQSSYKPIYQLLLPLYSSLNPSCYSAHLPMRFVSILGGIAVLGDPPRAPPRWVFPEEVRECFLAKNRLYIGLISL